MLTAFQSIDTSVFLFFNGLHSYWADVCFYWIANRFFWIPLYALLLFFIVKKQRKRAIPIVLFLVLGVLLTDQTCNWIKKSVERPRPSHSIELEEQVHLIDYPDGHTYRGGAYGFPSSHAANSIFVAIFAAFYAARPKKWAVILLFVWAMLLGYSRLYLGVHYPSDLIVGYLLGTLYAFLLIFFENRWTKVCFKHIKNSNN